MDESIIFSMAWPTRDPRVTSLHAIRLHMLFSIFSRVTLWRVSSRIQRGRISSDRARNRIPLGLASRVSSRTTWSRSGISSKTIQCSSESKLTQQRLLRYNNNYWSLHTFRIHLLYYNLILIKTQSKPVLISNFSNIFWIDVQHNTSRITFIHFFVITYVLNLSW